MKKVKSEIAELMAGLESDAQKVSSRFVFPETFIGFQGHFPNKKVLPGVCQIQSALATIERARRKHAVLKEVVLAKYFAPVGPNEEITCVCTDVAEAGEFIARALITKGPAKVSELKLRVAFEG